MILIEHFDSSFHMQRRLVNVADPNSQACQQRPGDASPPERGDERPASRRPFVSDGCDTNAIDVPARHIKDWWRDERRRS
jgi:hypothetical protein